LSNSAELLVSFPGLPLIQPSVDVKCSSQEVVSRLLRQILCSRSDVDALKEIIDKKGQTSFTNLNPNQG